MKEIENEIRQYLSERKWDQLRPGDLSKSISIEAGELLEIFQWQNPELGEVKNNPDLVAKIRGELADVLIYCIDMAVLLELDTETLIKEKLEQVKKKYPAELFQTRAEDRAPGTEDIYLKIKREHRMKGDI